MCSIMAWCGRGADDRAFAKALDKTTSRGPDDARVLKTKGGLMGFRRLSIMGLTPEGMQPFELNNNAVVCNGEIYGFAPLRDELKAKGYTFKSDSDCEILLPMYEEYGTEMFKKLDAEFACVIYDGKNDEWIAARDPIGIRPLYYTFDKGGSVIFASEPKNLVEVSDDKIHPFPPGHYYKDGKFICFNDIAKPSKV